MLRKKKKDKRQRRVNQNDLTIEELLDSPVFRKFSNAVEHVFDSAEDINFGSLDPSKNLSTSIKITLFIMKYGVKAVLTL